ncbi:probable Purine nucleoside phosphorylase [Saccharomycodes ludwigii]|uniref:Purine nucleoside phosphorylase n=1 Tax=Saccharomycodes ludwigii TaxID=36035 RepID=A0A376BBL7_9ASCO|nr:hypothetical protein SCDLUD_000241 [Saccharomycodes ludwigii]KAH3902659.1 hypothetical protein SCDLUD_000241 [Saccharomycodes ludwigii]SSD62083.1 probable Purine nucleoside phosphorylase [Saccharomycodes ludwigii]
MSVEEAKKTIQQASDFIQANVTAHFKSERPFHPHCLIICGSGLSGITSELQNKDHLILPYSIIPGFASSTVQGHNGELWFGFVKQTPVVIMSGRFHFYEGHSLDKIVFPIRALHEFSISHCGSSLKTLVATNASGGLNPIYEVGDLMLLYDHVNLPGLCGNNPLRGPNYDKYGPRFLATSDCYNLELRKLAFQKKEELKIPRQLHEGTYCFVAGPTFESRAESFLLRNFGGDTVGMSTVPEVIIARHCGWNILAISVITNKCVMETPSSALDDDQIPLDQGKANHDEVLEMGKAASKDLQALIEGIVSEL